MRTPRPLVAAAGLSLAIALAGCSAAGDEPDPTPTATPSPGATATPSPGATATPSPGATGGSRDAEGGSDGATDGAGADGSGDDGGSGTDSSGDAESGAAPGDDGFCNALAAAGGSEEVVAMQTDVTDPAELRAQTEAELAVLEGVEAPEEIWHSWRKVGEAHHALLGIADDTPEGATVDPALVDTVVELSSDELDDVTGYLADHCG